jgi:integrase
MIEIIEGQQPTPQTAAGLVFPSAKPGTPMSDMVFNALMNRRMGKSNVTAHGFRSSFRTWAGEQTSFPWNVAEAAIAHWPTKDFERAYFDNETLGKRRQLMDAWEAFINGVASGSNVVLLRSQA